MTSTKDKPDNVVDDPSSMSYPTNVGAPAFTLPDVVGHKTEKTNKATHQLMTKFEELKKEYFRLAALAEDTSLVYNAEYNFIPIVGDVYHLYQTDRLFLSMIEPERWSEMKWLGSFRYTSDATWERLDD